MLLMKLSKKFWGMKSQNYKKIVQKLVKTFKTLGANISIKLHYLDSHLDYYPKNLSDVSDEQGERSPKIFVK